MSDHIAAKSDSHEYARTILYFPTISVPNGLWLRRALLYWDNVASIVPHAVSWRRELLGDPLIPYTKEISYLRHEGVFKPIAPEFLFMQEGGKTWHEAHLLEAEFRSVVSRVTPKLRYKPSNTPSLTSRLHVNKLSSSTLEWLLDQGFAKPELEGPEGVYRSEWYLVEKKIALLYMSLLAKYVAAVEKHTVTGTDRTGYFSLSYSSPSRKESAFCWVADFLNVLPVPREDTPLSTILDFRDRRRSELLEFRAKLDSFQKDIQEAKGPLDAEAILLKFRETIEWNLEIRVNYLRCEDYDSTRFS